MHSEIRIRRYQPGDVEAIYDAVIESRAELSRWMPWCHEAYSRRDTQGWVESRPIAWERNEDWSFLIVDSGGRLLGSCGVHRIDLKHGVGDIGYWVRTSATGRGVATEATKQLCRWAFEVQGLERIEILASVENVASRRVAEKAGGVQEGILRQRLRYHGCRHDAVLFALLNDSP